MSFREEEMNSEVTGGSTLEGEEAEQGSGIEVLPSPSSGSSDTERERHFSAVHGVESPEKVVGVYASSEKTRYSASSLHAEPELMRSPTIYGTSPEHGVVDNLSLDNANEVSELPGSSFHVRSNPLLAAEHYDDEAFQFDDPYGSNSPSGRNNYSYTASYTQHRQSDDDNEDDDDDDSNEQDLPPQSDPPERVVSRGAYGGQYLSDEWDEWVVESEEEEAEEEEEEEEEKEEANDRSYSRDGFSPSSSHSPGAAAGSPRQDPAASGGWKRTPESPPGGQRGVGVGSLGVRPPAEPMPMPRGGRASLEQRGLGSPKKLASPVASPVKRSSAAENSWQPLSPDGSDVRQEESVSPQGQGGGSSWPMLRANLVPEKSSSPTRSSSGGGRHHHHHHPNAAEAGGVRWAVYGAVRVNPLFDSSQEATVDALIQHSVSSLLFTVEPYEGYACRGPPSPLEADSQVGGLMREVAPAGGFPMQELGPSGGQLSGGPQLAFSSDSSRGMAAQPEGETAAACTAEDERGDQPERDSAAAKGRTVEEEQQEEGQQRQQQMEQEEGGARDPWVDAEGVSDERASAGLWEEENTPSSPSASASGSADREDSQPVGAAARESTKALLGPEDRGSQGEGASGSLSGSFGLADPQRPSGEGSFSSPEGGALEGRRSSSTTSSSFSSTSSARSDGSAASGGVPVAEASTPGVRESVQEQAYDLAEAAEPEHPRWSGDNDSVSLSSASQPGKGARDGNNDDDDEQAREGEAQPPAAADVRGNAAPVPPPAAEAAGGLRSSSSSPTASGSSRSTAPPALTPLHVDDDQEEDFLAAAFAKLTGRPVTPSPRSKAGSPSFASSPLPLSARGPAPALDAFSDDAADMPSPATAQYGSELSFDDASPRSSVAFSSPRGAAAADGDGASASGGDSPGSSLASPAGASRSSWEAAVFSRDQRLLSPRSPLGDPSKGSRGGEGASSEDERKKSMEPQEEEEEEKGEQSLPAQEEEEELKSPALPRLVFVGEGEEGDESQVAAATAAAVAAAAAAASAEATLSPKRRPALMIPGGEGEPEDGPPVREVSPRLLSPRRGEMSPRSLAESTLSPRSIYEREVMWRTLEGPLEFGGEHSPSRLSSRAGQQQQQQQGSPKLSPMSARAAAAGRAKTMRPPAPAPRSGASTIATASTRAREKLSPTSRSARAASLVGKASERAGLKGLGSPGAGGGEGGEGEVDLASLNKHLLGVASMLDGSQTPLEEVAAALEEELKKFLEATEGRRHRKQAEGGGGTTATAAAGSSAGETSQVVAASSGGVAAAPLLAEGGDQEAELEGGKSSSASAGTGEVAEEAQPEGGLQKEQDQQQEPESEPKLEPEPEIDPEAEAEQDLGEVANEEGLALDGLGTPATAAVTGPARGGGESPSLPVPSEGAHMAVGVHSSPPVEGQVDAHPGKRGDGVAAAGLSKATGDERSGSEGGGSALTLSPKMQTQHVAEDAAHVGQGERANIPEKEGVETAPLAHSPREAPPKNIWEEEEGGREDAAAAAPPSPGGQDVPEASQVLQQSREPRQLQRDLLEEALPAERGMSHSGSSAAVERAGGEARTNGVGSRKHPYFDDDAEDDEEEEEEPLWEIGNYKQASILSPGVDKPPPFMVRSEPTQAQQLEPPSSPQREHEQEEQEEKGEKETTSSAAAVAAAGTGEEGAAPPTTLSEDIPAAGSPPPAAVAARHPSSAARPLDNREEPSSTAQANSWQGAGVAPVVAGRGAQQEETKRDIAGPSLEGGAGTAGVHAAAGSVDEKATLSSSDSAAPEEGGATATTRRSAGQAAVGEGKAAPFLHKEIVTIRSSSRMARPLERSRSARESMGAAARDQWDVQRGFAPTASGTRAQLGPAGARRVGEGEEEEVFHDAQPSMEPDEAGSGGEDDDLDLWMTKKDADTWSLNFSGAPDGDDDGSGSNRSRSKLGGSPGASSAGRGSSSVVAAAAAAAQAVVERSHTSPGGASSARGKLPAGHPGSSSSSRTPPAAAAAAAAGSGAGTGEANQAAGLANVSRASSTNSYLTASESMGLGEAERAPLPPSSSSYSSSSSRQQEQLAARAGKAHSRTSSFHDAPPSTSFTEKSYSLPSSPSRSLGGSSSPMSELGLGEGVGSGEKQVLKESHRKLKMHKKLMLLARRGPSGFACCMRPQTTE